VIDTHAHLNFPEYSQRIDQIVADCQKAGLTRVVIASSNLEESQRAIELAQKYPDFLYASVGIHPQKTDPENNIGVNDQLKQLKKLVKDSPKNIVAVGETGLDDSEPPPPEIKRSLEEQKELFKGQLQLAAEFDLPVIIHARGLVDETIKIIRSKSVTRNPQHNNPLSGVFHCYTGGKKRISKILDLPGKWYFGVDGNVTYDQGLQNVVAEILQDKLLLETDSPFLAPEPHRGETNTPAYLPLIAAQIAKIWGTDIDKVTKITTQNAERLFKLSK
jgi:TatD DNase family protein